MLIRLESWGVLVYALWALSIVVCLAALLMSRAEATKFVETAMVVSWSLGWMTLLLSKIEVEE